MLTGICCCRIPCLILVDDFDRADGTNIGGNWTEVGLGNASISTNRLQITSACKVITSKGHPLSIPTCVIRVTIIPNSGSFSTETIRVVFNYKDTNNYLYVEYLFTYSGSPKTEMKFYRRSGGVSTQQGSTRTLDSSNGFTTYMAEVCYDGIYAMSHGHRQTIAPIVDGYKVGMEYASITFAYFNNFSWSSYNSGLQKDCPTCYSVISCLSCVTTIPNIIICDLGAGGLTDGTWNYCDQLKGDYSLLWRPPQNIYDSCQCCWTYALYPAGNISSCAELNKNVALSIVAKLYYSSLGFKWTVEINNVMTNLCCNTGNAYSCSYETSFLTDTQCGSFPITLSKTVESIATCAGSAACTGSLPATIELRT